MRSMLLAVFFFLPFTSRAADPEVNMTTPEIIARWGYPAEIHTVTTGDNYILTMHRIPYGKGQQPGERRPVAFLQHPLEASSSTWVTNLPEFSLSYMLADAGFDVWMGNSRGNLYSIGSPTMDTKSHEYWKFRCTLKGYSNPFQLGRDGESYLLGEACEHLIFAICGPSHQMNLTRLPVFLSDEPGGTSSQNILHLIQMVRSGRQQMFDYENRDKNELHYGPDNKTPPIYDITKIKADTYLHWSPDDWLADEIDVTNHLLADLPKQFLKGNYKMIEFNHLDFVWGNRAAGEIYKPMIKAMLDDYNSEV